MIMHRDERGRRALEALFADLDPAGLPCRADQPAATLLYGLGSVLEESELSAVATTAQSFGDASFYLVFLEAFRQYPNFPDVEFTFNDLDAYHGLDDAPWGSETGLSSPNMTWGILCRLDLHSVATGPVEFVRALNDHWPVTEDERVSQFLGTMDDDGVPIALDTWPGLLLRNIYGDERARTFIDDGNW